MNHHSKGASPWFMFGAIALLVVIVFFVAELADQLPLMAWRESLRGAGLVGGLVFMVVGVCATAIGLPRQLLAGVAGYAYGVLPGLLLSLAAAIGGCAATVLFARYVLSRPVQRRFTRQVNWLQRAVRDDTFLKVIVLRLQPLGTNLATNLSAGVLRLNLSTFLSASLIGYIPQMLVFSLAGSGVAVDSRVELILAFVLFLLSLVLAAYLWKRHRLAADVP